MTVFITFVFPLLFLRKNAENAMQMLNGTVIGKQSVRLSWGRTPGNKQVKLLFMAYSFMILHLT